MAYYNVCDITLIANNLPQSFSPFITDKKNSSNTMTVEKVNGIFKHSEDGTKHLDFTVFKTEGGWIYESDDKKISLFTDNGYLYIKYYKTDDASEEKFCLLLRIIIECRHILSGGLSLHSACIEKGGIAYAFSGKSGVGKSTRAKTAIESLNYTLLSGDRPAINVREKTVFGVPWDGKEAVYLNKRASLKAIIEVRRSKKVRLSLLSDSQAYSFLSGQIFIPMWDTVVAAYALSNLKKLTNSIKVYRVYSYFDKESISTVLNAIESEDILPEGKDMKLKDGFILKEIADEYMLMPTGSNIRSFSGTVVLNEVSAFIIKCLEKPSSKENILQNMLEEYDVDRATAEKDIEEAVKKLCDLGVIDY